MMIKIDSQTFVILVIFILAMALAMASAPVFASSGSTGAGGTGLPWETGLQSFRSSITGPVAFTVLLVSLVGIGATLAFGGEINNVLRMGILFILAGAFVASGAQIISILFSGAVIEDEAEISLLTLRVLGVV